LLLLQADEAVGGDGRVGGIQHEGAGFQQAVLRLEIDDEAAHRHALLAAITFRQEQGRLPDIQSDQLQHQVRELPAVHRKTDVTGRRAERLPDRTADPEQTDAAVDLPLPGLFLARSRQSLLQVETAQANIIVGRDAFLAGVDADIGHDIAAGHTEFDRLQGQYAILHVEIEIDAAERNAGGVDLLAPELQPCIDLAHLLYGQWRVGQHARRRTLAYLLGLGAFGGLFLFLLLPGLRRVLALRLHGGIVLLLLRPFVGLLVLQSDQRAHIAVVEDLRAQVALDQQTFPPEIEAQIAAQVALSDLSVQIVD